MKGANRAVTACLLVVAIVSSGAIGRAQERTIEDRLIVFAQQLRMGLTLAAVAAYSPTRDDLRLHAQQLVNLLEGAQGKHFVRPVQSAEEVPGLLVELTALGGRFEVASLDMGARDRIVDAAGNLRIFLTSALEAALSALDERRIDRASTEMLRAYALLLAAYEGPRDVPYVPALWTILRVFDLTVRVDGGDHRE